MIFNEPDIARRQNSAGGSLWQWQKSAADSIRCDANNGHFGMDAKNGTIKNWIKAVIANSWFPTTCLSLARNSLFVLTYHRIRQNSEPNVLADSLLGPDGAKFEAEMRWLAENTNPVSEAEVADCFRSQRLFRNRSVLVTFDDAYRDNFDVAAPILKKYSIPAIFFIPTNSITLRRVGWWDEIAWSVKNARCKAINIAGRKFNLLPDNLTKVVDALTACCKRLPNEAQSRKFIRELQRQCNVSPVPEEVADASLMTWQQINELGDYGISVGGHTLSHSILARLEASSQRTELVDSKLILEQQTGRPVVSVAYPYGGSNHFGDTTKRIARSAGFQLGFSLVAGTNRVGSADAFGIRRLLASRDLDSLRLRMAFAALSR